MKTLKTTAIAALMTAAVGLSAILPATAQEAAATPAPQQQMADANGPRGNGPGQHNQGPRQGGGAGFLNFERGTEGVEIALVRLSHAIEMTAEQQALFDTLKTDALAAADTFSKAVEGLRPAKPADGTTAERPSITERLDARIAIETAQLDALKSVQPAAKAFFDSLTDEQKAELMPARPDRGNMQGKMGQGNQHGGQNGGQGMRQGHGPMGAPAGAPTDAPAPTNG
ncbi:Spy/CpxP family protein refolding chaperone [Devosia sp. FKR38]|uniref:Spy/CpxP family protein refolding chaperone n=1 Tax=Devosia sp. FKR38 TaxID=2562312 RepID=UPI001484D6F8|nr:Spy/CpxP family protein refolding chaperone [Devosia sp. FKR38]